MSYLSGYAAPETSPYATTADLQARWRTLDGQEQHKAELALADAERDLRREFPGLDERILADPQLALEVNRITCLLTRRRLVAEDAEDLDDVAENSGVYGRRPFTPDESGLEITANERRILRGPDVGTTDGTHVSVAAWSNVDPGVAWPS